MQRPRLGQIYRFLTGNIDGDLTSLLRQFFKLRVPNKLKSAFCLSEWQTFKVVKVRHLWCVVACSAGVFWMRECTFSYLGRHLGFATVEVGGEEIFPEGVGSTGQTSKMAASNTRFII